MASDEEVLGELRRLIANPDECKDANQILQLSSVALRKLSEQESTIKDLNAKVDLEKSRAEYCIEQHSKLSSKYDHTLDTLSTVNSDLSEAVKAKTEITAKSVLHGARLVMAEEKNKKLEVEMKSLALFGKRTRSHSE